MIRKLKIYLAMLAMAFSMPLAAQQLDSSFYSLIDQSDSLCKYQPYMALELSAQARMMAEQSGDKEAMGLAYFSLGECYFQTRIYYRAMEMYFKSFEIFSDMGNERMVAKCFVNIARTYYSQEVFDIAEQYCVKAINICKALQYPEELADAYSTLGQVSIVTNEDVAIDNMTLAKNIYDSLQVIDKSTDINIHLAKAYTHMDMPDTALALLDYNLERYLLSKDKGNIGRTYMTLADTYYSTKEYNKASNYYNIALGHFYDCKMVHDALVCRTKLARLLFRTKEYKQAQTHALRVLREAEIEEVQHGTEEVMLKHRACYFIYKVYSLNGDLENALQYCEKFAQTGDSIYALKKQEQFSEFQISLESQQKEKELEMVKMATETERLQLEKEASNMYELFLIIVITLVVVVVIIYYRRYKEKLQNNTTLALNNARMEQEIQERKIAENELRNSEEKYHLLFRKTPVGIIQFNDKFIITAVNDRLREILNLKHKTISGQDLYSLIPQKAFEGYDQNIDFNNPDSSKMFKKEIKMNVHGDDIYLSISLKSYRHNTGVTEEQGGIMIVEDITERKLAEEHKLIYNAASNDIINILPESIFLLDSKGNYKFARIPSLPVHEQNAYIGKNIREMLRPDILLPYLVAFNTVRKTGEEQYAEYQTEDDPACQIYNEARFVACEGDNVLVIVRDISRQKMAENKLKRAKNSAESGSKAKSEFIMSMTSDVKIPLESILKGCEELVAYSQENENSAKLKEVLNTALSVNETITDMLKLTEVETGTKVNAQTLNPVSLARDVFEIFRSRAEQKNLEYIFQSADDVPGELMLDKVRIRQILFNILSNAVKYTNSGSVVFKVYAENAEDGNAAIKFSVSDTGQGLTEQQMSNIFSPENGKKGMALTKKMADSLKGKLSVVSQLDNGSEFTFSLPVAIKSNHEDGDKVSQEKGRHVSEKTSRKKHNDSMREYISVLKFAVIPEYKNVKSDMSFESLIQFVNKFKEQSAHYNIDKGVDIANELLTNIQNYDIPNITINIRKLETYILTSIKELQGE